MIGRVSIIIPVYNVAEYIEECLISVFNQTYSDIEVIVVNDCSPDNSMGIVENVKGQKNDSRIKIINHSENKGLSEARNSGIRAASGEYLFFLDSDDRILPNSIEMLMSECDGKDMAVGGIITHENKSYSALDNAIYYGADAAGAFLKGKYYVMACNKLIKRNLIIDNNLYFMPGLLHEDNLWSYQLSKVCNSAVILRRPTYIDNIRGGSITTDYTAKNITHNIKWFNAVEYDILKKTPSNIEIGYLVRNKSDIKIMALKYAGFKLGEFKSMGFNNVRYPNIALPLNLKLRNILLKLPLLCQYSVFKMLIWLKRLFVK